MSAVHAREVIDTLQNEWLSPERKPPQDLSDDAVYRRLRRAIGDGHGLSDAELAEHVAAIVTTVRRARWKREKQSAPPAFAGCKATRSNKKGA